MAPPRMQTFDNLLVDHIRLFVNDIATTSKWLVDGYGFAVYATADAHGQTAGTAKTAGARSVGIGGNDIRLVITEPLAGDHPAAAYVEEHGDGVADIALRVPDAAAAFGEAVRRGAEPVSGPRRHGDLVTATVIGFGHVVHTFVQRPEGSDKGVLPGLRPVAGTVPRVDSGLTRVDHFAVCLEPGGVDATVEFYETVLDFGMIFTERIVVGSQAMNSKVVQSRNGAVTLTLLEPDQSCDAGQIDEFLRNHGGPGVQHVAFATGDIVHAMETITARGVDFLSTPASYYGLLGKRLKLIRHSVQDLQRFNILVDEDQDGQLFQIFARSVHPRNTLFLEVIERQGATTFGSGNAKALYEAVEHQQAFDLRHSEDGAA
jgi:4-hydroxymandelate synthase